MIDLSDGLAGDLRHILNASAWSARNCSRAPCPSAARQNWRPRPVTPPKPAFAAALTDGEDFELLFTVASKDAVKLLDAWKKTISGREELSCIGKIVAGDGIIIRDKTSSHKLSANGYVHFK